VSEPIRSYGIVGGPFAKVVNYYRLLQGARRSMSELPEYVGRVIGECRALETMANEKLGVRVEGLRALEIGAGQLPRQMAYFARKNQVTGIDLDRVAPDLDLSAYVEMLRRNGPGRVLKTMGRKALGFDRRIMRELYRQLGCRTAPAFERMQMDAGQMSFADASFDFVYSVDVFEHLPDPARVLDETMRVLRPGGAAVISLLPYTAEAGPHDLRTHGGPRQGLAYWAHLRPAHRADVQPSVYVNKLCTADWEKLVAAKMPGASFERSLPNNHAELVPALRELRAAGELDGYDDGDLLGYRWRFCWRKPS
jgi:SAM-dependent methyltransferase